MFPFDRHPVVGRSGPFVPTARYLSSPPEVEPLSPQDVKDHSRIQMDADDALIQIWIKAARIIAQKLSGEIFITQTWQLTYPYFPHGSSLPLPLKPIQSIESVIYIDTAGADQEFGTMGGSPEAWQEFSLLRDEENPRIVLKPNQIWPVVFDYVENAITVSVVAGYGDSPDDVPGHFRASMLLLCGHFYENRENVVVSENNINALEIPLGIRDLIAVPTVG